MSMIDPEYASMPQAMQRDELARRRQEGGAWLRALREKARLSQRELAESVGQVYYSFVSQIEAGKGRVPIAQMELWANALQVSHSYFARGVLKFYDPITHDMLFSEGDETDLSKIEDPSAEQLQHNRPVLMQRRSSPGQETRAVESGIGTQEDESGVNEDLRARISRLEAILMMRGSDK